MLYFLQGLRPACLFLHVTTVISNSEKGGVQECACRLVHVARGQLLGMGSRLPPCGNLGIERMHTSILTHGAILPAPGLSKESTFSPMAIPLDLGTQIATVTLTCCDITSSCDYDR